MPEMLMLDAQSVNRDRISLISGKIAELLPDFFSWIRINKIAPSALWYADIYDIEKNKHVARIEIESENRVVICPGKEKGRVRPFRRRILWLDKMRGKI